MEIRLEEALPSPPATIEDIQKRLFRPPNSQIASSFISSFHREAKLASKVTNNTRLEDYLDPVLLAAVRKKIGGKRRSCGEAMKVKRGLNEFDLFQKWHGEEGSRMEENGKSEKTEAADLKIECDLIGGRDGGDDDECALGTPFLQFERIASKRFAQ